MSYTVGPCWISLFFFIKLLLYQCSIIFYNSEAQTVDDFVPPGFILQYPETFMAVVHGGSAKLQGCSKHLTVHRTHSTTNSDLDQNVSHANTGEPELKTVAVII